MPPTAQNLYFHLGLHADDDGFAEHFTIMRMTESKPDDLKILQAKELVHIFDDKVLVILDWKKNNYIQADRYEASHYLQIYREELAQLSQGRAEEPLRIQNVSKMDTQVRVGEGRIGKVNTRRENARANIEKSKTVTEEVYDLFDAFEPINPDFLRLQEMPEQFEAMSHLADLYSVDMVKFVIEKVLPVANKMPYVTTISTPMQLQAGWVNMKSQIEKQWAIKQHQNIKSNKSRF